MYTAAATWLRSMARPTTVGKGRRPQRFALILLGATLLSGGCATHSVDPAMSQAITAAERKTDLMLKQARTEAGALRGELADARIAEAKQEAELEDLRAQVSELRQTVEIRQAEQSRLRAERDKLSQVKSELQTQLVEVPLLRQSLAEAKIGETRAQARLKEVLERIKKDGIAPASSAGGGSKNRIKPVTATMTDDDDSAHAQGAEQAVVRATAIPTVAQAGLFTAGPSASDKSGTKQVTVLKSETLWGIARRFNLTVHELQAANGLRSTSVQEGQILIIPGQ